MKNTGKAFEALTEQVYTRFLAQDGIVAKVARDVTIPGKSGATHQLDVTFEFGAAGASYRTIVQCKDWASAVKQEQVQAFRSVLDDIPGQPRGIMVSRSGFQSGARTFAEHHGIVLYELRAPRDEDWDGLIRSIETTLHIRAPRFDAVELMPDQVLLRAEILARGLPGLDVAFSGHPSQVPLVLASGERYDLDRLLNSLAPKTGLGPIHVRHEFAERVLARIPGSPVDLVPMLAVEATISVAEHTEIIRVSLDHLIAFAFKDVLGGAVKFLGHDGRPITEEDG